LIPKFSIWIENEGEKPPALSQPQHKIGEGNKKLIDLVKTRVDGIVSELKGLGKGSKEDILSALDTYLKSSGFVAKDQQGQDQQGQDQQGQGQDQQGQDISSMAMNQQLN